MANSIGGNNPIFNPGTLENLRQTSGTSANQTKFSAPKSTKPEQESGGVHLSDAARKSLQGSHSEHIKGHEGELAHHAGLGEELKPESKHEQKVERGNERAQDTVAQQVPHGEAPSAPDSADKVQARLTAAKLAAYDDPDTVYQRVLENQMKQGVKKMSNMKTGPEAQEAGKMEMKQASFLADPLDIRGSGNDRSQPMSLEFPDETLEMAKEAALEVEQENLIAGS
ncbi:hypothetical protein ABS71_14800 [bacterium SCN 62-11]|nr:MAG: hypothetical protein ABS71_14800 [bacterium SCN 62-11]